MKGDRRLIKNFLEKLREVHPDPCTRKLYETVLFIAIARRDQELREVEIQDEKDRKRRICKNRKQKNIDQHINDFRLDIPSKLLEDSGLRCGNVSDIERSLKLVRKEKG